MQVKTMQIGGRSIGVGHPVYIVAELSANHHQDFENAVQLLQSAKACHADAVKLQTYTPDTITLDSRRRYFQIEHGTVWDGRTLHDLYGDAYTPWEWQPKLKVLAEELGMQLFSSPFDATAVDFLAEMDVPAYKVASFEIVDIPLIQQIARTGKPMLVSTGMATLAEIDEAVQAIRAEGNEQIALLKCTSAYPAPPAEMNLRTIAHMSEAFGVPVGLSDHTLGIAVPIAATALGATIIEKHLTLSRDVPGPDSSFSLEPAEFKAMVTAVREAQAAVGSVTYAVTAREQATRTFRRSLFVTADVRAGDRLTPANVRSIRPGHGLPPRYLPDVLGRRARQDILKGTPLSWELIA